MQRQSTRSDRKTSSIESQWPRQLHPSRVWIAVFDIDGLLVTYRGINSFVAERNFRFEMGFFHARVPLTIFARTENLKYLTSVTTPGQLLPHELPTRRMYESPRIKTISRVSCAGIFVVARENPSDLHVRKADYRNLSGLLMNWLLIRTTYITVSLGHPRAWEGWPAPEEKKKTLARLPHRTQA